MLPKMEPNRKADSEHVSHKGFSAIVTFVWARVFFILY